MYFFTENTANSFHLADFQTLLCFDFFKTYSFFLYFLKSINKMIISKLRK